MKIRKKCRICNFRLQNIISFKKISLVGNFNKYKSNDKKFHGEAFNFGPQSKNNYSVKKIVQLMEKNWKNVRWEIKKTNRNIHETNILKLNSYKSFKFLNWKSCLKIEETMKLVSEWYKNYYSTRKKYDFTFKQIDYYEKILKKRIFKK